MTAAQRRARDMCRLAIILRALDPLLRGDTPDGKHHGNTEVGTAAQAQAEKVQAGARLTTPEPSSEGRSHNPARRGALAPCTLSTPALDLPADDWREARRLLRAAGHEIKQYDGRVLVDGVRCDDPRLYPPGSQVPQ